MNDGIYWIYLVACLLVVCFGILLIIQSIGPGSPKRHRTQITFDSKAWDKMVGVQPEPEQPQKITEATEERVELPNGMAVQKRSVRVWN